MFKELAPLVRHRAVLFTMSHVEDDQFRVNVIPKKIGDGENDALTTPVSVTGTVEDLDKELPETLLHFVSSHLELKNSLERAKAEMEEASKAARAEARKKSGIPITKKDPAGNSSKPAMAPEAPARRSPSLPKRPVCSMPRRSLSEPMDRLMEAWSLPPRHRKAMRTRRSCGKRTTRARPKKATRRLDVPLGTAYLCTAFPGDIHNSCSGVPAP
jgi:PRTRC genetic system protein E